MSYSTRCTPIIIGGPSGIGKTSIVNSIVERWPNRYKQPLTYTSRPKRQAEDHERYEYLTKKEILSLAKSDKIVSLDEAYGNLYGICKNSIKTILSEGRLPIKDIHPQNQHKFTATYPDTLTILLVPGGLLPWLDNTDDSCRSNRSVSDREFFPKLDKRRFSIIKTLTKTDSIDDTAAHLETKVRFMIANCSYLKAPSTPRDHEPNVAPDITTQVCVHHRQKHSLPHQTQVQLFDLMDRLSYPATKYRWAHLETQNQLQKSLSES